MKLHILVIILMFITIKYTDAQPVADEVASRPKIGLVLSGGGAKGVAHVGVLKILEEAGIVPDFITGTSMGSIIGGLYASGYTATELDSIIRTAKWNVLLSDQVPLQNVMPAEKHDYYRFLSEFNVTSDGLKIGAGFIHGQLINEFLSELTWPVAKIKDFDKLPIPYRCVAADLVTGQPYVFKEGDLATAMRASMSIPSVFAPIIKDTMLLVDGGVLDNFPVKLCRDMGADIIIGVNVGFTDPYTVDKLNNMRQVLVTSSSIGSNLRSEESIALTDIYIQPDLKPYTTASFFDSGKIIDLGMVGALPFRERLEALADSVYCIAPVKVVERPQRLDSLHIVRIDTEGLHTISHEFLVSQLGFKDGDTVTIDMVNNGLRKILGTRFLDQVTYELHYSPPGYIMKMKTVETYPTKVAFSLNYSDVFGAALVGNITFRNMVVKNTRLSISAEASKSPQINFNLISYLGDQMDFGLGVDAGYSRSIVPVYRGASSKYGTFGYRLSYASFSLNYFPTTNLMFSPTISIERHILLSDTGFPELFDNGVRKFGFNQAMLVFPIRFNSLNRRYFPTRGLDIQARGGANFWLREIYRGKGYARSLVDDFYDRGDNDFLFLSGSALVHFPLNKRLNLSVKGAVNYYVINDAPLSSLYFVGGDEMVLRHNDLSFTGLHYREQLVENYLYSQVKFRFNFSKIFYATAIANGIYNTRPYSRFMPSSISYLDQEWLLGYGLSLSANTMLGPVSFGFGMNSYDNHPRFNLNLGLPF